MLLNTLKVTNSRGSILNLPLEDISGGFKVQKIEGLDPVKATLVSSSFANLDGAQYQSSRREPRNIKLQLGLEPDYGIQAVKDLRDQLYLYFMPKSLVTLGFHLFDRFATILNETLDVDIQGRVETFDSDLFTKDPVVDISLMCFDPDFYDPVPVVFDGMSVADMTETVLPYAGSIETGVIFTLLPDRAMPEFTIYHRPPDESLRTIDFTTPLVAGDILKITSIVGSKSVILNRAGLETSVLYGVSPQSGWLELQPGDNNLRVYAAGAPVPYTVEYTNKYGGL